MAKPRTRFRTHVPQSTGEVLYTLNDDEVSTVVTDMGKVTDTMNDFVVDRYHDRIAQGEVIFNPMTYVKTSTKATGGGYSRIEFAGSGVHERTGSGSHTGERIKKHPPVSNGWVDFWPAVPTIDTDLDGSAKLQALGNLDRSPYSFAEDIAEFHETLRFLRDPFGSLRNLSQSFQKDVAGVVSRNKSIERAKAIADVWTTYQFAFSPLVRSVNDAIASYNDKIYRPKRRTARGKAEDKVVETSTSVSSNTNYEYSGSATLDKTIRAGILYEVSNPSNDWRFKYGLRFKDIPETVWAILPYSFMVDRMWNVSQAVRGFTSFLDPSVKILSAWTVEKSTTTLTRSWIGFLAGTEVSQTILPDNEMSETFRYERTGWSISMNDFVPPLELEGLIDSSIKIADLAALILQKVR